MSELLAGKVAFVTGATRGIGRSIAVLFAEQGATVYATGRDEGSLDELHSDKIVPLYFDVTDTQALKTAVLRVKKEQGRIDCLVNNAGIMENARIGMVTTELMHKVFDVNVFAAIELLQLAARIMMRQGSGTIINFTSIVGVNGSAGQIVYSASKGAIIAATKAAAKELAPSNIRVNAVAPGMIDTDMFRSVGEQRATELVEQIGMHRFGTPTEVAQTCLFLASDLSEYLTGQIIGVDGSAII
jgi:3-oxoacyl-[acyl-carrier protein] reductase